MVIVDVTNEAIEGERTFRATIDYSVISTVASSAGMILAIIGLGGIRTYWVAALTLIAIGIAQLFEVETLGSNVSALIEIGGRPLGRMGIGMMTGRLPGGIAGIVLGGLSLFPIIPGTLLPVATITFGLVLILGAWAIIRLNDFHATKACRREETRAVARAGVRIAETLEGFIGCGSIALGILALGGFGPPPVTLTLVAVLGIGFSSFLNSTIFSERVQSNLLCEGAPVT